MEAKKAHRSRSPIKPHSRSPLKRHSRSRSRSPRKRRHRSSGKSKSKRSSRDKSPRTRKKCPSKTKDEKAYGYFVKSDKCSIKPEQECVVYKPLQDQVIDKQIDEIVEDKEIVEFIKEDKIINSIKEIINISDDESGLHSVPKNIIKDQLPKVDNITTDVESHDDEMLGLHEFNVVDFEFGESETEDYVNEINETTDPNNSDKIIDERTANNISLETADQTDEASKSSGTIFEVIDSSSDSKVESHSTFMETGRACKTTDSAIEVHPLIIGDVPTKSTETAASPSCSLISMYESPEISPNVTSAQSSSLPSAIDETEVLYQDKSEPQSSTNREIEDIISFTEPIESVNVTFEMPLLNKNMDDSIKDCLKSTLSVDDIELGDLNSNVNTGEAKMKKDRVGQTEETENLKRSSTEKENNSSNLVDAVNDNSSSVQKNETIRRQSSRQKANVEMHKDRSNEVLCTENTSQETPNAQSHHVVSMDHEINSNESVDEQETAETVPKEAESAPKELDVTTEVATLSDESVSVNQETESLVKEKTNIGSQSKRDRGRGRGREKGKPEVIEAKSKYFGAKPKNIVPQTKDFVPENKDGALVNTPVALRRSSRSSKKAKESFIEMNCPAEPVPAQAFAVSENEILKNTSENCSSIKHVESNDNIISSVIESAQSDFTLDDFEIEISVSDSERMDIDIEEDSSNKYSFYEKLSDEEDANNFELKDTYEALSDNDIDTSLSNETIKAHSNQDFPLVTYKVLTKPRSVPKAIPSYQKSSAKLSISDSPAQTTYTVLYKDLNKKIASAPTVVHSFRPEPTVVSLEERGDHVTSYDILPKPAEDTAAVTYSVAYSTETNPNRYQQVIPVKSNQSNVCLVHEPVSPAKFTSWPSQEIREEELTNSDLKSCVSESKSNIPKINTLSTASKLTDDEPCNIFTHSTKLPLEAGKAITKSTEAHGSTTSDESDMDRDSLPSKPLKQIVNKSTNNEIIPTQKSPSTVDLTTTGKTKFCTSPTADSLLATPVKSAPIPTPAASKQKEPSVTTKPTDKPFTSPQTKPISKPAPTLSIAQNSNLASHQSKTSPAAQGKPNTPTTCLASDKETSSQEEIPETIPPKKKVTKVFKRKLITGPDGSVPKQKVTKIIRSGISLSPSHALNAKGRGRGQTRPPLARASASGVNAQRTITRPANVADRLGPEPNRGDVGGDKLRVAKNRTDYPPQGTEFPRPVRQFMQQPRSSRTVVSVDQSSPVERMVYPPQNERLERRVLEVKEPLINTPPKMTVTLGSHTRDSTGFKLPNIHGQLHSK